MADGSARLFREQLRLDQHCTPPLPTLNPLLNTMATEVALDTTVVSSTNFILQPLLTSTGPHHGRTLQRTRAKDMQELRYARAAQLL